MTVATRLLEKFLSTVAVCPEPLVEKIELAISAVLIKLKSAPVVAPEKLPVVVKAPALVLALMAIVAIPFTSVIAVF